MVTVIAVWVKSPVPPHSVSLCRIVAFRSAKGCVSPSERRQTETVPLDHGPSLPCRIYIPIKPQQEPVSPQVTGRITVRQQPRSESCQSSKRFLLSPSLSLPAWVCT